MIYYHEKPEWPQYTWDSEKLAAPLAAVRHRQGRLIGRMEGLGFSLRNEAVLQTLTQDVMKSSEIEGEILDLMQVRSSIARRLGMDALTAMWKACVNRHSNGTPYRRAKGDPVWSGLEAPEE